MEETESSKKGKVKARMFVLVTNRRKIDLYIYFLLFCLIFFKRSGCKFLWEEKLIFSHLSPLSRHQFLDVITSPTRYPCQWVSD